MNAAKNVVAKFGGTACLSEVIGKGQSTTSYWTKTGTIPAKWHPVLLQAAANRSIDLSPSDFLEVAPVHAEDEIEADGSKRLPKATHWGELPLGGASIPCYVLEDSTRVFSLKGVVVGLIGTEGGQLAEYLKVRALKEIGKHTSELQSL